MCLPLVRFGRILFGSVVWEKLFRLRADRHTDRQADRQTGRQADMQTGRQTDRQASRQASRQTARQYH